MNKILQKLPLPVSGLMLGLVALGNLLGGYSPLIRSMFGAVSFIIFLMLVAKFIKYPACIKEGLDNPVVGGVMATFPMSMMILSTYIKPYSSPLALGFWIIGIVLHLSLIAVFTKTHILKFNIKKVFPTYFIVYAGIVAASVAAPVHQMQSIGQILFWVGFLPYMAILPVVIYRAFVVKEIPEMALPTLAIFAAPGSLCLAGYMNSFPEKNIFMVYILLAVASITILIALSQMPKLLRLKFYPSFSAFTFPFVISAIAIKGTSGFFASIGSPSPILKGAASFLEALAVIMVLYVLAQYSAFLLKKEAPAPSQQNTTA